jgi:uncharacterized protein YggE
MRSAHRGGDRREENDTEEKLMPCLVRWPGARSILAAPRLKPLRLLPVVALAAAVGLALTAIPHAAVARADTPPNGITVSGSGTAELPPDMAHVSGNVETQADTANNALSQNSQTVQAVLAAVRAFGVPDANIKTTNVSVYPIFSSTNPSSSNQPAPPPTIVGYRATNGIDVKVTDLSQVGSLIQTMVNAGVNDFSGVQYGLQNPEQIRQMALQAAIADAQQSAQTAAAALGVHLGGVLNFTTQSSSAPPVPAPRATFAAAAPAPAPPPPVIPGPLSADTTVTVTYAILGS